MRLHNSLRIVWIPMVLQFACIAVVFAVDRPNPRELVPIWIPWTLIMMAVAAVIFCVYRLATQAKSAFLRCLCTMALVIVGAWILWDIRGGGDPLSVYPVRLHAVLALLYGALSIWRMIRRRFPNKPVDASTAVACLIACVLSVCGGACSRTEPKPEPPSSQAPEAETKSAIPEPVLAVINDMTRRLDPSVLQQIKATPFADLLDYYNSLGRPIRNHYMYVDGTDELFSALRIAPAAPDIEDGSMTLIEILWWTLHNGSPPMPPGSLSCRKSNRPPWFQKMLEENVAGGVSGESGDK
jgi:hypothetical protein